MRPLVILLALAVLIMAWAVVAKTRSNPDELFNTASKTTYVVKPGDTLWEIAMQYCPDGINLDRYIDHISDENNLTSSTIYVGQHLTVFEFTE